MRIVFLWILVLMLVRCSSVSTQPEEENITIVRGMFKAFNEHDWKGMANYYADTALFLDPSLGLDYVMQTREQTVKKYSEMQAAFPDIHDEVITLVADGDKVAVQFVSTGTSPDGTSFRLPIACVLTISNHVIVRDATYYNNCP
jgi:ketosteroid isomerase-like protein